MRKAILPTLAHALLALVITAWTTNPTYSQLPPPQASPEPPAIATIALEHFISRKGNKLFDGESEFRFLSFNAPELVMREEPYWGFNDRFEQTDLLESINQFGGRVIRPYVMSIKSPKHKGPRHIEGHRQYNEEVFQSLDFVLAQCNRLGVRIIVPFIDNWQWWGGIEEFAALRGKSKSEFYTDQELKADYKHLVSYVLNRKNSITGVLYRDDPAVLAWETGNELRKAPAEWTLEVAQHIKSIDANHLVIDGNDETIHPEVLNSPFVDIVVKHYYRGTEERGGPTHYAERYVADHKRYAGKKPLLIGEFGFAPLEEMQMFCQKVNELKGTGALVWSLRQHEAYGGFRWHKEGNSGFSAYHLPGFASGAAYDEAQWLSSYSANARKLSGLEPQIVSEVRAPELVNLTNVLDIRWRGVAMASSYEIESSLDGKTWEQIGSAVSDAAIDRIAFRDIQSARGTVEPDKYWPVLFQDLSSELGAQRFYRVRARVGDKVSPWSDPKTVVVARNSGARFFNNIESVGARYQHVAEAPLNSLVLECKSPNEKFSAKLFSGKSATSLVEVALEKPKAEKDSDTVMLVASSFAPDANFIEIRFTGEAEKIDLRYGLGSYRVVPRK